MCANRAMLGRQRGLGTGLTHRDGHDSHYIEQNGQLWPMPMGLGPSSHLLRYVNIRQSNTQ